MAKKNQEELNITCCVCDTRFNDPNYPTDGKLRRGLCSQECAGKEAPWALR